MKWMITIIGTLLLASFCMGQNSEGIVRIVEEGAIRQVLDHRKALNFSKDRTLKVWSVQLFLSRDKYLATQKVAEAKKKAQNLTSKIDWFYEAPYYRIYAGGFYTKLEAVSLLNELIEMYPDAIVFKNTEAKPADM
ncbi:hypothetical protein [Aureispira anguillae]|uniref:Sporulation related domain-containing protein n=1 Tax=Aureispira anguillae TaxID=2864201 RepID=A0A916DUI5_9BACT|nr:hypothetical protein [Aureispira anguillae]BDS14169.1 hypothetical protein AsAng_0049470 [Aureispira anguillae]